MSQSQSGVEGNLLFFFHFVHPLNFTGRHLGIELARGSGRYACLDGGGVESQGGKVFAFGDGWFDGVVFRAGNGAGDAGGGKARLDAGLAAFEFGAAGCL